MWFQLLREILFWHKQKQRSSLREHVAIGRWFSLGWGICGLRLLLLINPGDTTRCPLRWSIWKQCACFQVPLIYWFAFKCLNVAVYKAALVVLCFPCNPFSFFVLTDKNGFNFVLFIVLFVVDRSYLAESVKLSTHLLRRRRARVRLVMNDCHGLLEIWRITNNRTC